MTDTQIDALRVGSVLHTPSGDYRVVRHITRWPAYFGGPPNLVVMLAIRQRSWTRRCYTVLYRSDLRQRGYRPTPVVMRLHRRIDRQILRDYLTGDRTLSPEDVRGLP